MKDEDFINKIVIQIKVETKLTCPTQLTESTDPLNRHLYTRQAVRGTMPSQAIATKV